MTRPIVPVIHGVANRDEKEFNDRVKALEEALGGSWELLPVFWNPLGANPVGIEDAIPPAGARGGVRGGVRGAAAPSGEATEAGLSLLSNGALPTATRAGGDAARRNIVVRAATGGSTRHGVTRASPGRAADIRAAIEDEWPHLTTLPLVSDRETLELVGALIARAAGETTSEGGTRGPIDDVRDIARQVLTGADDLVGAIVGRAGEQVNDFVRRSLAPAYGKGIGDVLVYNGDRQRIHARVREVMLARDPKLGRVDAPVSVIGHSLGGIIAFDLATRLDDPLHYRSLVTFGSQSSILHVLAPRGGALTPYAPPHSVAIPDTIGHWTNIWEAWDPLAFVMAPVFGPPDRVTDIRIPHRSTAGVWSHSSYWAQDDAIDAIRAALERGG